MPLELRRFFSHSEYTLGLFLTEERTFFTLELPWKENKKKISCIPIGKYRLGLCDSPKFGPAISILDVPNREGILFHPGNSPADTEGCILPGFSFDLASKTPITASRKAFERLYSIVKCIETPELLIIDPWLSTSAMSAK